MKYAVFLSCIFLFAALPALGGNTDLVAGFAWSETIGWISFNCTNTGTCGQSNYGVTIDQSGNMLGYAWSENIGWIRFDPPGPYPSQPNSAAKLSNGNSQATGWARACGAAADPINCSGAANPNSGGWDGWIKMAKHASDGAGVPNYGVTFDTNAGQFHGWAWGSSIVGWISFNCAEGGNGGANVCGQSNYKVTANLNQPPVAAFSCSPSNCIGYTGAVLTFNNNSTDPNGPSDIVQSQWDIVSWGSNPDVTCTSPSALCNYTAPTSQLAPGTYNVKLTVQDAGGLQNSVTQGFTIKQNVVANFDCSLDGSTWVGCSTIAPAKGEQVFFRDRSSPSQGATSIVSWAWTFQDGNPASSTSQNPSTKFQLSGIKQVSLTATDNTGQNATKQVNISVGSVFPQFQEISPF